MSFTWWKRKVHHRSFPTDPKSGRSSTRSGCQPSVVGKSLPYLLSSWRKRKKTSSPVLPELQYQQYHLITEGSYTYGWLEKTKRLVQWNLERKMNILLFNHHHLKSEGIFSNTDIWCSRVSLNRQTHVNMEEKQHYTRFSGIWIGNDKLLFSYFVASNF